MNLKVLTCICDAGAGCGRKPKGASFCFVTHPATSSWNQELHPQRQHQHDALYSCGGAAALALVEALQPVFLFHPRGLAPCPGITPSLTFSSVACLIATAQLLYTFPTRRLVPFLR
jgi:hypothetical protein